MPIEDALCFRKTHQEKSKNVIYGDLKFIDPELLSRKTSVAQKDPDLLIAKIFSYVFSL